MSATAATIDAATTSARALSSSISPPEVEVVRHDGMTQHGREDVLGRRLLTGQDAGDALVAGLAPARVGILPAVQMDRSIARVLMEAEAEAPGELEGPLAGDEPLVPDGAAQ